VLNLVCYVSLCEGLRAGAGSLSYIVHVDCGGLSTIVIKNVIITAQCTLVHMRGLGIACRPSVRLSVRPSVCDVGDL